MTTTPLPLRLVAYTAQYLGEDIARDLEDIRARASRNNARDGLTGALVFDRGRFVQVVEGPHGAVERVLARIGADPRSGPLEVLMDLEVTHRSMAEWSMWTGHLDPGGGLSDEELRRVRDAFLRGFRADATGFVLVLRGLIEAHEGGAATRAHAGDAP
jgi:hypothetical protein